MAKKNELNHNVPFRIGMAKESSLHAAIKEWYALPNDQFEVEVAGFFIDIIRLDEKTETQLLIEIQTRNFTAIRRKLLKLLPNYQVRLVYPIPQEKWIVRISVDGEVKSRRKSPRTGTIYDLFSELLRIPDFINDPNFTIELLLTGEEHIWCEDGKGSWRRRGVSVKDRRLLSIIERVPLFNKNDFLRFLPSQIASPFSNKDLATHSGNSIDQVRKMTYCLKKMGTIKEVGKRKNELLFEVVYQDQFASIL